jgi:ribA/ribD-fused uncharacterized protein
MVLKGRLRLPAWIAVATVGACASQQPAAAPPPPPTPATQTPPPVPISATQPAPPWTGKIGSFQGDYRFLSNFWPATVEYEGIVYPTAEHAYQATKTLDMAERRRIAALPTPAQAKRAGEALKQRTDWPQIKYDVMLQCVRYKFTHHPELAAKLLATGDAYLEEGNTWNDHIWGVCDGWGTNWLGKVLMSVRWELQAQPK